MTTTREQDLKEWIDGSAKELADQLTIDKVSANTLKQWDLQALQWMQQIEATASTTFKARTEFAETQELVQALREKDHALQRTFAEIDQLEAVVKTVKETYNKVAASVEDMERSVGASLESRSFSPFSFRLTRDNSQSQPYFPPPLPVDIYHTPDLFPRQD
ncbi:hypothetical protein BCR43DRAFT_521494 [Syncephalastrum racemosum]|uniref:Uncharacterized protein n=1 Tax=Syncephalastrum racemosum TaxID=13706 RepID=A0A1X2HM33_SYNRA|nr:hypothetical protein BCR43DRAFT_521494 [Syncephalastrum racemosum]